MEGTNPSVSPERPVRAVPPRKGPSAIKKAFRVSLKIKTLITVILLIGVGIHLYLVYDAARQLSVEDMRVDSVVPSSTPGNYTVTFVITLDNPTSTTIDVDRLIYHIYIEEEHVGDGEKDFFSVVQGTQEYSFSIEINIWALPGPTRDVLLAGGGNMTVEGKVTIPAKAFGVWTYTHITVPYSFTEPLTLPDTGGGGGISNLPPTPVVLSQPIPLPPDSAQLSWTENLDVDFACYEVHYSTIPGFTPSNETLAGTITDRESVDYTIEGLQHLTTYYFKIRVYDTEGLYADSNEVSLLMP
ncbi:MAG: hypothetical protein J7L61_02565 [Thermoplasmata archaeon]|nr:hypothetical protein [Thermoplasmata archaeon]